MNTQYTDDRELKKKFLAPLIMIMLCAVTLTGAAYAYSASISGHADIAGDYYSIDLYEINTLEPIAPTIDIGDFNAYTTKAAGEDYVGHVDGFICGAILYVKVQSSKSYTELIDICGSAKYTKQSGTSDMYDAWNPDGKSPIECTVSVSETGGIPWTVITDDQSFAIKTNTFYYLQIQIRLPSIAEDLGSGDPNQIPDLMKFVGSRCISFEVSANVPW